MWSQIRTKERFEEDLKRVKLGKPYICDNKHLYFIMNILDTDAKILHSLK